MISPKLLSSQRDLFPPNSLSSFMNGLISYMGAYMLSHFSHVQLFATLWIIACQASLPMGFSRQEYWSRLPVPPPGNLPDPRIEPSSITSPALAVRFFNTTFSFSLFPQDPPNNVSILFIFLSSVPAPSRLSVNVFE